MLANIGYYICVPFALLTKWFYTVSGSYGIALILFTLVVKLIILPFQIKSKKSMIRMNRMQGRLKDIQTRYANNREKQNEEIQKLYAEEGINPMSGCLWSFLPLPILIVLYYIIRTPLRYFMLLSEEAIEKITEFATKIGYEATSGRQSAAYDQIYLTKFIHENWEKFTDIVKEFPKLIDLDYQFLGMDLAETASNAFSQLKENGINAGWSAIGVILLPFIAAAIQFFMSKVTTQTPGQQVNSSTKAMTWMFPLMTLWMGFMFPAALCVYWIANSAFATIQEVVLNKFFKQKIEEEESEKEREKREKRIAKYEEQKRIANLQKEAVKKPTKKPEVKKEVGTNENGRIDNRPYARGRAYVEDRYDEK